MAAVLRSLRLLVTGLLAFWGVVSLSLWGLQVGLSPPTSGILAVVFLLAFYLLAARVFGWPGFAGSREKWTESIRRLEETGMLVADSFEATRAFQVDEFEDEGLHYFLELQDGGVLFLSGQYLYEYEPDEGRARRFPCARFRVRRHRQERYAVDLECAGAPLEPDAVLPPFTVQDYQYDALPQDGDIIRDRTYDQILHERTAASTAGGLTPRT